jgi:hypothetical protein
MRITLTLDEDAAKRISGRSCDNTALLLEKIEGPEHR